MLPACRYTQSTATAARDALSERMDNGDELLVFDVTGDAPAWRGCNSGSTWLMDTWA